MCASVKEQRGNVSSKRKETPRKRKRENIRIPKTRIVWAWKQHMDSSLLSPHLSPLIGLGHYDPLSSHEIDGVRKEKERLTAVSLFPAHFSQLLCGLSLRTLRTCLCLTALSFFHTPFSFSLLYPSLSSEMYLWCYLCFSCKTHIILGTNSLWLSFYPLLLCSSSARIVNIYLREL